MRKWKSYLSTMLALTLLTGSMPQSIYAAEENAAVEATEISEVTETTEQPIAVPEEDSQAMESTEISEVTEGTEQQEAAPAENAEAAEQPEQAGPIVNSRATEQPEPMESTEETEAPKLFGEESDSVLTATEVEGESLLYEMWSEKEDAT